MLHLLLKYTKKFLLLSVISLILISLSGCFDVGFYDKNTKENGELYPESDIENYYMGYYMAFKDVVLIKSDGVHQEYNIYHSLFNKYTMEFKWENEEYEVKEDSYIYMIIRPNKDLKIESIAFYYKGNDSLEEKVLLEFYVFKLSSYPMVVAKYNDDPFEKDGDGNYERDSDNKLKISSDFNDPNDEDAILHLTKAVSSSWDSITISGFENGYLEADDDDFIVIRFENNSAFGKKIHSLNQVSFSVTNLLIRNIE